MGPNVYPTSKKSLLGHKILKFSFKIRYIYTPSVPTSVYVYWIPVIHRIYIPQLNISITRLLRINKSGGLFWSTCNALYDWSVCLQNLIPPPPLSRLLSEFSDFFHLRNVKYRLLSNLYLAEFSKEEKWRWTIIWNEFKLNDSIGDKKTTSKLIHQFLLMAENEFTPKICKIKFLKKLTIRVALYMLISIDHLFCWSVVNEWWKCWAKGYITNVWWEPSTDIHW